MQQDKVKLLQENNRRRSSLSRANTRGSNRNSDNSRSLSWGSTTLTNTKFDPDLMVCQWRTKKNNHARGNKLPPLAKSKIKKSRDHLEQNNNINKAKKDKKDPPADSSHNETISNSKITLHKEGWIASSPSENKILSTSWNCEYTLPPIQEKLSNLSSNEGKTMTP